MNQASIFEGTEPLKIKKPVRLIELFAGYGSQALALKYLGVPFEHWRICEWAYKSIIAYKDCHMPDDCTDYSAEKTKEEIAVQLANLGISANYNEPMSLAQVQRMPEPKLRQIYNAITATHNLVNVSQMKGSDLRIEDTDKYTYIMSLSFPCQDLSNAGQRQGMSRGSGTRSGLLWEVERLLNECSDNLPQVLLMENVPQVHSSKNIADFREWIAFLDSKGYTNVWKDMNAKDYGIPQNRNRCFMVSFLGDYFYDFPTKQKLNLRLGDVLEQNVDESYYLSNSTVEYFIANTEKQKANGNGFAFKPFDYSQDRNVEREREREHSSRGADTKWSETRRQLHSDPLNAEPDGSCRTIKAQYAKSSTANFVRQGTFGATGVMTCEVARTVQATASKHQASDNYIKEKQK